jgi:hypothetical protein
VLLIFCNGAVKFCRWSRYRVRWPTPSSRWACQWALTPSHRSISSWNQASTRPYEEATSWTISYSV